MRAAGHCIAVVICVVVCVSAAAQPGADRAVACDAKGAFHVLFTDARSKTVIHQTWQDGGWDAEEILQGYYPFGPALAADDDGGLHGVWSDAGQDGSADIFYSHFVDGKWSDPVDVTEGLAGWDCNARIATLPDKSVHVVWSEVTGKFTGSGYSSTGNAAGLMYRRLKDGQWSETAIITPKGETPAALVSDGKGGLVVICSIGFGPMGRAISTHLQGDSWAPPEYLATNASLNPQESPNVAADANGDLHMVYTAQMGGMGLMYCCQTNGVWSAVASLGQTMGMPAATMARGPDGSVHLLRSARTGMQNALIHTRLAEGQWGEATTVATSMMMIGLPRMAVDREGVVHVLVPAGMQTQHYWAKDGNWQGDQL